MWCGTECFVCSVQEKGRMDVKEEEIMLGEAEEQEEGEGLQEGILSDIRKSYEEEIVT